MKDRIRKIYDLPGEAVAVLLCDVDGTVVAAENNSLFAADITLKGHRFSDLVATRSADAAARIVRELQRGKTIISWEVSAPINEGRASTVFVSGLRQVDNLVILLSVLPAGIFELVAELVRMNRERPGAIASSAGRPNQKTRAIDDQIFEELSRLNNELANAKRELSLKNAALKALNTEKDKMLGVVVHDFRNPLSVVAMCAQIISEKKKHELDKEDYRLLKNIMSSSAFMVTMVEDLLYVSKNYLGKLVLRTEEVDLGDFIENTIELNRIISWQDKISLNLNMLGNLGVARIDPGKMRQVFNNLIGNSVRLSPARSSIDVVVSKHEDRLTVRISDQGPGIPVEQQGALFEDSTTRTARGVTYRKISGLGLSICKSIVEAHEGNIGFESTEGVGSTFFFDFPCR